MPTYLCIQRSHPVEGEKPAPPSPAQMEEMYAKFNAWREKFAENIVDMGAKLGSGGVVMADGRVDGPFAETKEVIGGYMLITAESLDEAEQIVRELPGLIRPGSSCEVREVVSEQ